MLTWAWGVVIAAGVGLPAAAHADPPYPSELPDFSRASNPPSPFYSPRGGTLDRPVLVILTDLDGAVAPATEDARQAGRYFATGAGDASVAAWYREQSFGRLLLRPAREPQGTADDGVVRVHAGNPTGYYRPGDITDTDSGRLDARRSGRMNRRSLELADAAGVDFSAFESNGRPGIGFDELLVVNVIARPPGFAGTAATRRVEPVTLDGTEINLPVSMVNVDTNRMTEIHELGHVAFGMRDFYGFGVGHLALAGTSSGDDTSVHGASAYEKVHLGWVRPTVATHDGYRTLRPAHLFPDAVVLYDPRRRNAADDFFIVENRQRDFGTSDSMPSDSGLVIWRASETNYNTETEHLRPIELMRPNGARSPGCVDADVDGRDDEDPPDDARADSDGDGARDEDGGNGRDDDGDGATDEDWPDGRDNDGDTRIDEEARGGGCSAGTRDDAWNPWLPDSPREMTASWLDRSQAGVAVRAVERIAPDGSMRAYLDVPGAHGVLVDCWTAPRNGSREVAAGRPNRLTFEVMNTGERPDVFRFQPVAPAGWHVTAPPERPLAPGERATIEVVLVPPPFPPYGRAYALEVRASSTTPNRRGSDCTAPLEVAPRSTTLTYVGDTEGPWGRPARLRARVVDTASRIGIAGVAVSFSLRHVGSVQATTDLDGYATAQIVLPDCAGDSPATLDVRSFRHREYAEAGTTAPLRVLPRPARVTMLGDSAADWSDSALLQVQVQDSLTGSAVRAATTDLLLGAARFEPAVTDDTGQANARFLLTEAPGATTARAEFRGQSERSCHRYAAASSQRPFEVERETLERFTYVGDGVTSGPTDLAVVAEEEPDGSPGDLRRATLRFSAAGLLRGDIAFTGDAPVSADGLAQLSGIGLEPDLYTVDVKVDPDNPYWEGGTSGMAEVVVADVKRRLDAAGKGGAKPVEFDLAASYVSGAPSGHAEVTIEDLPFTGREVHWLVVRGSDAVVQVGGTYDGQPAVLRMRVHDAGAPGAGADRFSFVLRLPDLTIAGDEALVQEGEIDLG